MLTYSRLDYKSVNNVVVFFTFRANPHVAMVVGKYHKEDVVLMLPPEKPTIDKLGHFQVWCRQYKINFGEFSMRGVVH